jgi:hypothetical protein
VVSTQSTTRYKDRIFFFFFFFVSKIDVLLDVQKDDLMICV